MNKQIQLLSLMLAVLLLFSSCNAVIGTTGNKEESSPAEESETISPAQKEKLSQIKARVAEKFDDPEEFYIQFTKESVAQLFSKGEYCDADVFYAIAADEENENYHSPEIAQQLEKGMFINEVLEVLGSPHFNAAFFHLSGVMMLASTTFDYCTMYLLNDGNFLFLRYIPVFIGDYDRVELKKQIPNFDDYEQYEKFNSFRWGKLHSIEILTEEELVAIPFSEEYLRTAWENQPPHISLENLKKIQVGMTYSEAKMLLGSSGIDSYLINRDEYMYIWCYTTEESASRKELVVFFKLSDTGELIVSKVVG